MSNLEASKKYHAPSMEECDRLLSASKDLLSEAWNNPDDLGVESEIHSQCLRHWQSFDGMQFPLSGDVKEKFKRALWLSWYAVWRARDYSIRGWERKLRGTPLERSPDGDEARQLFLHHIYLEGESWPMSHAPPFDRDGNPVELPEYHFGLDQPFLDDPLLWEGWMMRPGYDHRIKFRVEHELSWCYFAPDAVAKYGNYRSCWLDQVNTTLWKKLSGCVVERGIRQSGNTRKDLELNNTIFFSKPIFQINNEVPPEMLNSIRCEDGACIKFANGLPETVHFEGMLGIKSLDVLLPESGPLSFSFKNVNLQLSISRPGSSRSNVIDSLSLSNFKGHLSLRNFGGNDLNIEHSCLSADFYRVSLSTCDMVRSTLVPEAVLKSASLGLQLSDVDLRSFNLEGCELIGDIVANKVVEIGDLTVRECTASGSILMEEVRFSGPIVLSGGETPNTFSGVVDISCSTNGENRWIKAADFRRSVFEQGLNLTNRKFDGTLNFTGAVFHGPLLMHGTEIHQDTRFSRTKFDWSSWVRQMKSDEKKDAYADLSSSFRTLRQAMEANHAHSEVANFHTLQLRTRNHLIHGAADIFERVVGNFYHLIGNYGTSFVRPLVGLFALWLATILFYILALGDRARISDIADAAMSTTLRPFLTFSPIYGRDAGSLEDSVCLSNGFEIIRYLGTRYEFAFAFASLLQSVLSLAFLFLFLLAIRRKYQLS